MTPRVLVVSYSGQLRDELAARAVAARCDVGRAKGVEEALAFITRHPIDAVICHVTGPGAKARALAERLRKEESDACIILVGPELRAECVAALLRAGALDYLTLPLRRDRLEQALREGLEVRRSFIQVRKLSATLRHMNEELARDRDQLQQWNRNLGLLNQLGQSISATLETEEIVRTVGPRLGEMLPFEMVGIVWLQPERVWIHAPGEAMRSREVLLARARRFAKRVPGAAVRSDARDPAADAPDAPEILEVPLQAADQPLGLIHLARRKGGSFDQHERELVKAVATSLALALRNAEAHSHVQKLALRDALTGLLNRRALWNILNRRFRETERYGTPLCLIMADLDHFKVVNDRFGHLTGDLLLKEVARLLTRFVRAVDVVARYGGEEFAVVLPGTDLSQGLVLANRVREAIARHAFLAEGVPVTLAVSMGVARIPDQRIGSVEHLIAAADQALYQAKAQGRNRVEALNKAEVAQVHVRLGR